MAVVPDFELPSLGLKMEHLYCGRCGGRYFSGPGDPKCNHTNTADPAVDDTHAERIRARWAIGRQHNPDHDETDYRDVPK